MLTLYFSGTGNSQYIAEKFSEMMQADCHSIEENLDFASLIEGASTIAICYPIYGSCVPEIMRKFITQNKTSFDGKKIIIFCTQVLFSGDGARVFTELLTDIETEVIYAEHFRMPNNICNFLNFSPASSERIKKYVDRANKKLEKICYNIQAEKVRRRGFTIFSKHLGLLTQRLYFRKYEQQFKQDLKISPACNLCGQCIRICPTNNLKRGNNNIEHSNQCTICYRCVNICPQKAITVFLHKQVTEQYKGIEKGIIYK